MLDAKRLEQQLAGGASRVAVLQSVLRVWQHQAADLSIEGRLHVLRLLRLALREVRLQAAFSVRGYDPRRHAALLQLCRIEEGDLRKAIREELDALSQIHTGAS